jgi:hypothetical protein
LTELRLWAYTEPENHALGVITKGLTLMATKDKGSVAIQMVSQAHATRDPTKVRVRQELSDVFGGVLFVVNWFTLQENRDFDTYVFFDGDKFHLFYNPVELTRYFNQQHPSKESRGMLREVLSVGGVPALIALIITITICYLVTARGLNQVPDVLSNALSIILGFYFGSKVAKDHSKDTVNTK